MTSKYEGHTPGPWEWEPAELPDPSAGIMVGTPSYVWVAHPDRKLPPDHPDCDPDAEMVICQLCDTVYPISTDHIGGDAWHGDPSANARLIADAPALLKQRDALREAMKGLLAITDRQHVAWDKARAALALCDAPDSEVGDG